VNKYTFIDAQKANFPANALCRALSVPESSYYDWDATGRDRHGARVEAKADLVAKIRVVHTDSGDSYGSPRIHDGLRKQGVVVSLRRVAEVMADAGIVGLSGREHSTTTTRRDRLSAPFPDLVGRNFLPTRPDTLWYGDVTYIWITDRFWYLATVIDAATKELVGWSFADHMRVELVADALHNAVRRRGGRVRAGLIFHSDRGSQYTSNEYGVACKLYQIRQSMGRRGVCYDNAGAESFFATIKRELVDRYTWNNSDILRIHLFIWIETWYNSRRTHSSIGMRTPNQAYTEFMYRSAA
jgi:putative transposase